MVVHDRMVGKNYSVLPPNIHPAKICSHVVDATTTFTRNLYQVVLLEYHHYQTRLLCRVPRTLSKGRKTLSKVVAECSTRRSAHGLSSTGDASFAECHFSGTRQKKLKQDGRTGERANRTGKQNGQTERANGTGDGNFAECQTRGTRQNSKLR